MIERKENMISHFMFHFISPIRDEDFSNKTFRQVENLFPRRVKLALTEWNPSVSREAEIVMGFKQKKKKKIERMSRVKTSLLNCLLPVAVVIEWAAGVQMHSKCIHTHIVPGQSQTEPSYSYALTTLRFLGFWLLGS